MTRIASLFFALVIGGCSSISFYPDNIKWVRDNKIEYSLEEVAEEEWRPLVKKMNKQYGWIIQPENVCFFESPTMYNNYQRKIYAKMGSYIEKWEQNSWRETNPVTKKYIDYCLNHELGHLREYLEGVAWHSKYAW